MARLRPCRLEVRSFPTKRPLASKRVTTRKEGGSHGYDGSFDGLVDGADEIWLGLRYVPKEEDQVRWKDAGVHTLHKLQDRMCIYTGGEETKSSERVS